MLLLESPVLLPGGLCRSISVDQASPALQDSAEATAAFYGGSFVQSGRGDRPISWRIQHSQLTLLDIDTAGAELSVSLAFPEELLQHVVLSDQSSPPCLFVATSSCVFYRVQLSSPAANAQIAVKLPNDDQAQGSMLSHINSRAIAKVSLPPSGLSELGKLTSFALCDGRLCLAGSNGIVLTFTVSSFSNTSQPASVLLLRPPESQFQRFMGGLFRSAPISPITSLLSLQHSLSQAQSSHSAAAGASGTLSSSETTLSLACALHADGTLRIWDTASSMQVLHQPLQAPEAGVSAKLLQNIPIQLLSSTASLQAPAAHQDSRTSTVNPPQTQSMVLVHWASSTGSIVKISCIRIQADLGDESLVQASVQEGLAPTITQRGPIKGLAAACSMDPAGSASMQLRCWIVDGSGAVSVHGDEDGREPSSVQLVEDGPHWESSAQAGLTGISVSTSPLILQNFAEMGQLEKIARALVQ